MVAKEDRPGYQRWREAQGYAREAADGLTVDPQHPPRFIHPAAEAAYKANIASEDEMLAALFNFRWLIYQDGENADENAKAAYRLLVKRLGELAKNARELVHQTRPPLRQRPRSADEQ